MNKLIIYIFVFITLIVFNSCIIVKENVENDVAPAITLSPKPIIPMSETLVRSKIGDMIAFLPKDWFFVDLEDKISKNVFAIAVNPDYTLSAIFSEIPPNARINELLKKEGLIGLARSAIANRIEKTAGGIKLQGKYTTINMGTSSFCKYAFSPKNSSLISNSVVFISIINKYYEFALVPMNIKGKPIPDKKEIEKIFYSIMATIQY